MKKNLLILFIILCTPFLAISQANVTVGTPYKVIDARTKDYFSKGSEILTVKIDGRKIYIQKLNAENLTFIKQTESEDMPDHYVLENLSILGNKLYMFYSLWDKPNETEQLFAREIDFEKGEFKSTGKNLIKVHGRITGNLTSMGGMYNFGIADKFSFNMSHDSSKMLVQYRLKPEIKNDDKSYDIIGLSVFDKDLNTIWSKEVKMPYTEKKMNNIDYSVDSKGNPYILTTVYDDNTTDIKKGKDDKANYHIELLRINRNSNVIDITPISIKDKFINKIWLYEGAGNYMICAGYYNNGKDLSAADGVILLKVGSDGKTYDISSYEIPLEILNQYVSLRTQKKNEKADDNDKAQFAELELRELHIEKDGSILLIGEQHFITSRTYYSSSGGSRTVYYYHYNDLLITKIDASGKLAWMKKIPKRQVGMNGRGGMGYKYISDRDNHYFVFLDNEKNLNLSVDNAPASHSDGAGGFLTAYKLADSNGAMSKYSIFNTRDVQGIEIFQFTTSRIMPLSPGLFTVEAYKKKKEDILIKVLLK
jgi:hypothetical protein